MAFPLTRPFTCHVTFVFIVLEPVSASCCCEPSPNIACVGGPLNGSVALGVDSVMDSVDGGELKNAELSGSVSEFLNPEQRKEADRSRMPAKRRKLASRNILRRCSLYTWSHLTQCGNWNYSSAIRRNRLSHRRYPCLHIEMARVSRRIDIASTAPAQLYLFPSA